MRSAAAVVIAAVLVVACGASVFEVAIGQCLNLPDDAQTVVDVEVVDCAMAHDAEVFGLPQINAGPEASFPGATALGTFAEERCTETFEEYVGVPYPESSLLILTLVPTQESWEQAADREAACLLIAENEQPLTGSLRATGQGS